MREWMVVIVGLTVFAGASVFALRGYRAPPPLAALEATAQRPVVGNAPNLDAVADTVTPVTHHKPPTAPPGQRVSACMNGGVTTYTDQPCPNGTVTHPVTITEPNIYTATPAPDVDMSQYSHPTLPQESPAVVSRSDTFGPSRPGTECRNIEATIKTIDEAARQGYSGSEGVRLTEERRHLRERYHQLNCCTTC